MSSVDLVPSAPPIENIYPILPEEINADNFRLTEISKRKLRMIIAVNFPI